MCWCILSIASSIYCYSFLGDNFVHEKALCLIIFFKSIGQIFPQILTDEYNMFV